MGGEVVRGLRSTAEEGAGPERLWVAAYSNDVFAYILHERCDGLYSSHRLWEEGEYQQSAFEVYGLPALRWTPEIEQRITACVDRLVNKLK